VIISESLFENFTVILMAGSEGELRAAWREVFTVESVIIMSLEEGRPLLSGSADAKAHSSSSSFVGAETGVGPGLDDVGLMKSNIDEGAED
jgi:hypothetical protein